MIDLETASLFPLLPISQAPSEVPIAEAPLKPAVKPFILVVADSEFLLLSWTGASTLGLFITGEGEPVRGTLEWSSHPISISTYFVLLCICTMIVKQTFATAFDAPYVTTLLPDGTIEIHSIETQALVQSIPAPTSTPTPSISIPTDRTSILTCSAGFFVPSSERESKLRPTPVKLIRRKAKADTEPIAQQETELANSSPDRREGDVDEADGSGDQDVEVIDAL